MSVDSFGAVVLRLLRTNWTRVLAEYERIDRRAEIRPRTADEIFKLEPTEAGAKIIARPTVLKVPAKANRQVSLYVVVGGWIDLRRAEATGGPITTRGFNTQVAYFRMEPNRLKHILGVHYDMDLHLPGHPVFHGQLASQAAMQTSIDERFNDRRILHEDAMTGIIGNVRIPTAQMDVFSVITQVAADHMISEASGSEVKAAFTALREACDFFAGAGRDIAYLNRSKTSECFRSSHWYEGER